MKKIQKFSAVIGATLFCFVLLASLFFVNCAKDRADAPQVTPTDPQTEIAFENLSSELDALNANFIAQTRANEVSNPQIPDDIDEQRRGRPRWWLVTLMDAAGGLLGAAIGSVGGPALMGFLGLLFGGSASAATYGAESYQYNLSPNTPDVYINQINNITEFDRLGYDHNVILQNINSDFGSDFFENADTDALYGTILEEMCDLGYDITEFNNNANEYKTILAEMIDKVRKEDIDVIYKMATDFNPNMVNEINIMKSYSDAYKQIDSSLVPNYSADFRNIVTSSNIPTESKQVIQSTVGIAAGSNVLWQVK